MMKRKTASRIVVILIALVSVLLPITVHAEDAYYTVTTALEIQNPVTSITDPSEYGSVTVEGNYTQGGKYLANTTVTLTATPQNGFTFDHWAIGSGGTSVSNPYNVTVVSDCTYTAVFKPTEYAITYVWGDNLALDSPYPETHIYGKATVLPTPNVANVEGYDFGGWSVTSGGTTKTYQAGESLGANDYSADIQLTPIWNAKDFTIVRHDQIGDTEVELGTVEIGAKFGDTNVSAKADVTNEPIYRGYWFNGSVASNYTVLAKVEANESVNKIYRKYSPRTYKIVYAEGDKANGTAELHTYGQNSAVYPPSKTGYTFAGWTITSGEGDLWVGQSMTVSLGASDVWTLGAEVYDNENWNSADLATITLTAIWTPNTYSVFYEGADSATNKSALQNSRTYNVEFNVPDLTRVGYTFLGWRVFGTEDDYKTNYTVLSESLADNVTLEAGWDPLSYTVTFDPSNGTYPIITTGDTSKTAKFDTVLPSIVPPSCKGFEFKGYYAQPNGQGKKYYESNGECVESVTWDIDSDTTLYADWVKKQYPVTVNVKDANGADISSEAVITINGAPYTGASYEYETNVLVTVTVKSGYAGKLTAWNGTSIPHAVTYSGTGKVDAEELIFEVRLLPTLATPSIGVNYQTEKLTGLQTGTYSITDGTNTWVLTVDAEGKVSGNPAGYSDSVSTLFGKTLSIVALGDGNTGADSNPQSLVLVSRPSAPQGQVDVKNIIPRADSTSVQVEMSSSSSVSFEFAISKTLTTDYDSLTWQSDSLFTGLNAGSPYWVYIRVKATATYPHGEPYINETATQTDRYLQDWIDKLHDDFRSYGNGENVTKLIGNAEQDARETSVSLDYEDQLQAIYQRVANNIAFAQKQDEALAEVREQFQALYTLWVYDETGKQALLTLCENAVSAINSATTQNQIDTAKETAIDAMKEVKIAYANFSGNRVEILVYASAGMMPEAKLAASRMDDFSDLRRQIESAIANGTVVPGGKLLTASDLADLLDTMDVIGAYQMRLDNTDSKEGPFVFTLLIPEDLRSASGLTAAYYDSKTAQLKVLDTTREGNQLTFVADEVAGFVLLADHTVEMKGYIVALSIILFCQIFAIAILLVCRRRATLQVSVLPISVLAVRFLPAGSVSVVIVLAALAILLQVVLTWLVLSSRVIFRGKREEPKPNTPKDTPIPAIPENFPTDAEGDPVLTSLTETEISEEENYEEIEPTEANDGTNAWYSLDSDEELSEWKENGEDFIEPAAATKYSLPDDMEEIEPETEGESYASESVWENEEPQAPEQTADSFAEEAPAAQWQTYEDLSAAEYEEGYAQKSEQAFHEIPEQEPISQEIPAWDGTGYDSDSYTAETPINPYEPVEEETDVEELTEENSEQDSDAEAEEAPQPEPEDGSLERLFDESDF